MLQWWNLDQAPVLLPAFLSLHLYIISVSHHILPWSETQCSLYKTTRTHTSNRWDSSSNNKQCPLSLSEFIRTNHIHYTLLLWTNSHVTFTWLLPQIHTNRGRRETAVHRWTPAHAAVCPRYEEQWMNETHTHTHTPTCLPCHFSLSTFVLLTPFIQTLEYRPAS